MIKIDKEKINKFIEKQMKDKKRILIFGGVLLVSLGVGAYFIIGQNNSLDNKQNKTKIVKTEKKEIKKAKKDSNEKENIEKKDVKKENNKDNGEKTKNEKEIKITNKFLKDLYSGLKIVDNIQMISTKYKIVKEENNDEFKKKLESTGIIMIANEDLQKVNNDKINEYIFYPVKLLKFIVDKNVLQKIILQDVEYKSGADLVIDTNALDNILQPFGFKSTKNKIYIQKYIPGKEIILTVSFILLNEKNNLKIKISGKININLEKKELSLNDFRFLIIKNFDTLFKAYLLNYTISGNKIGAKIKGELYKEYTYNIILNDNKVEKAELKRYSSGVIKRLMFKLENE